MERRKQRFFLRKVKKQLVSCTAIAVILGTNYALPLTALAEEHEGAETTTSGKLATVADAEIPDAVAVPAESQPAEAEKETTPKKTSVTKTETPAPATKTEPVKPQPTAGTMTTKATKSTRGVLTPAGESQRPEAKVGPQHDDLPGEGTADRPFIVESNVTLSFTYSGNYYEVRKGGAIGNVSSGSTVLTNNGEISSLFGTVEVNNGSIRANYWKVGTNSGTITESVNTVQMNNGEIGTVELGGQVTTNSETGTIAIVNGTVTTNSGEIGFVSIGGKVTTNTITGTITTLNGMVITNTGTIGAITDRGEVAEFNGGSVGSFEGVINSLNGGQIGTEQGEIHLSAGTIRNVGVGVTIDSVTGGTIENLIAGNTIAAFSGGTISTMTGGVITSMTSYATIDNLNGGQIGTEAGKIHITSGNVMNSNTDIASISANGFISTINSGTVALVSGGLINSLGSSATITQMTGGRIANGIAGTIKEFTGGILGTVHSGGKITQMTGGTIGTLGSGATVNSDAVGEINITAGIVESVADGVIINSLSGSGWIKDLENGTIKSVIGGSMGATENQINITSGTIESLAAPVTTMTGGTVKLFTGNAANSLWKFSGGTIEKAENLPITELSGEAVLKNCHGFGYITKMSGGTIINAYGPISSSESVVAEMTDGTIENLYGGKVSTLTDGTIKTVHPASKISGIDYKSGEIVRMTGGVVESFAGEMFNLAGGQLGTFEGERHVSGGKIGTISRGLQIHSVTGGVITNTNEAQIDLMTGGEIRVMLNGGVIKELTGGSVALGSGSTGEIYQVSGTAAKTITGNMTDPAVWVISKVLENTQGIDFAGGADNTVILPDNQAVSADFSGASYTFAADQTGVLMGQRLQKSDAGLPDAYWGRTASGQAIVKIDGDTGEYPVQGKTVYSHGDAQTVIEGAVTVPTGDDLIFNGNGKVVTIDEESLPGYLQGTEAATAVVYTDSEGQSVTEPTTVGTYDYELTYTLGDESWKVTGDFTITPWQLTAADLVVIDPITKVYDQTTVAPQLFQKITLASGEEVAIKTVGQFATSEPGDNQAISYTWAIAEEWAENILLPAEAEMPVVAGAITRPIYDEAALRAELAKQVESLTKDYDGSDHFETVLTVAGSWAVSPLARTMMSEDIAVKLTGTFSGTKAGADHTLTITGWELLTADASGELPAVPNNLTFADRSIQQKELSVPQITAQAILRSTVATPMTLTAADLTGVVSGDAVTLSYTAPTVMAGEMKAPVARVEKDLKVGLTGADAGNYRLSSDSVKVAALILNNDVDKAKDEAKELLAEEAKKDLNADDYHESNWKDYQDALDELAKVIADENATATEVQAAIDQLTEAIETLEKDAKSSDEYQALAELVDKINQRNLRESAYSKASWQKFTAALAAAKALLADPSATEAQLKAALADLAKAHDGLTLAATSGGSSTTGTRKPASSGSTGTSSHSAIGKTGMAASSGMIVAGLGALASALAVWKKRKK